MTKKRKKNGAFLIELLISIAIMSILSGVTLIGIIPQLQKARDAKTKEDLIQIRNALTQYYDDTGCFPSSLPTCGQSFIKNNFIYFTKLPCNPGGSSYTYETDNNSCHAWYKVLNNLENIADKNISEVGCNFGCGEQCNFNYGIASSNINLNQGCVKEFACSSSGDCIYFADPVASRCPATYPNDPTCQNQCSKTPKQCHDSRGKQN